MSVMYQRCLTCLTSCLIHKSINAHINLIKICLALNAGRWLACQCPIWKSLDSADLLFMDNWTRCKHQNPADYCCFTKKGNDITNGFAYIYAFFVFPYDFSCVKFQATTRFRLNWRKLSLHNCWIEYAQTFYSYFHRIWIIRNINFAFYNLCKCALLNLQLHFAWPWASLVKGSERIHVWKFAIYNLCKCGFNLPFIICANVLLIYHL